MVNRGWLYGLIVLLAQTCNPYYSANDSRNQYEEGIVFEDQAIEEDEVMEIPSEALDFSEAMEEAPPPMPEPIKPEREQYFKVVEDMPRFPGCEDKGLDKSKMKMCAEQELLKFVYANLEYPEIARENGIEGRAILQWVVNPNGSIRDIKILRDPGGGCGQAGVRVIEKMPKWIPGKQRGRPVPVQFTFPIQFKLDKSGK